MNKKYNRYIEYIINELEPPYFKNMENQYGLSPDEYKLVISKLYDQPVIINGDYIYDDQGNITYYEDSNGFWTKREFDSQGNLTYKEDSDGFWVKREYDGQRNLIYYEDSIGDWYKYEYDEQGNKIYWEYSDGDIVDKR